MGRAKTKRYDPDLETFGEEIKLSTTGESETVLPRDLPLTFQPPPFSIEEGRIKRWTVGGQTNDKNSSNGSGK